MQITLPENLTTIIQVALFIVGAYLFSVYLGMLVWTWRDIRARSSDILAAFLSVLLVALFNVAGLILYFILRPREVLSEVYERQLAEEALLQDIEDRYVCPECNRRVEADYLMCPSCHTRLRTECSQCGRLLNLRWDVCPYCEQWVESASETDEPAVDANAQPDEVEEEVEEKEDSLERPVGAFDSYEWGQQTEQDDVLRRPRFSSSLEPSAEPGTGEPEADQSEENPDEEAEPDSSHEASPDEPRPIWQ